MINTKHTIEQWLAETIAVLRHEPVASTTIAKQIIEAMQQEPDETIRKQQELLAVAREALGWYADDANYPTREPNPQKSGHYITRERLGGVRPYIAEQALKQLSEAIDD